MDRSVLPFSFPTNLVLVDDDANFLKNFSLLLNSKLALRTYSSANLALDYINRQPSIIDTFNKFTNITLHNDIEERVYLDLDQLHQQIYDGNRFSQVSLVIVDYDMPEMDGLEFCRRIKHPEIKRILLTGKANEKVAVQAFNQGLIERYIQKSVFDVDNRTNEAINELQEEFFHDVTNPINIALNNKNASFLADPQFKQLFSGLLIKNTWIEFYLWEYPKGILLVDIKGDPSFLFVLSEETLDTHREIAQSGDAPQELLKTLKERRHIPWFPTDDGYYTPECRENWQEYLYPVDFSYCQDDAGLCALVSPAPISSLDVTKIESYQSYLDKLDYEVNSG